MRLRLLALALVLHTLAGSAAAHPAPFSYLDIRVDGSGVHGTLILHDFDVAYELGLPAPEALLDPSTARAHQARIVALVTERLALLVNGAPVPVAWGAVDVLPDRQSLWLPFRAGDQRAARLTVEARLFPYDPLHQTFVNVHEDGTLTHQAIIDASRPQMDYYAGTTQGAFAVMGVFVPAGIEHILIGPDHILFLVALLLLGGSLWRLAGIVTAFTIGHSITLSLAALGIVTLPGALVEPVIALSIVVVAADNLLVRRDQRAGGAEARDIRAWVAGAFGLIHGFGFASVLQEFGLPGTALGWSLFSFNVGVEIGQLAIVLVVASALAFVRRRQPVVADRLVVAGSLAVMAAGAYWFVERVWLS